MTLGDFGVTLMGFSYMDLMSGFIGSFFYQIVWNALHACGLTVLPFLAVAIDALRENYESDQVNDQPHQQLNRLMTKLAVMVGVMILAGAPILKISDLAVRMQLRTCDKAVIESEMDAQNMLATILTTGGANVMFTSVSESMKMVESAEVMSEKQVLNRLSADISMSGVRVRTPIWWHFWRHFMLAVGSMITADLPCDNGLRALKHNLSTEFILDKPLAEELGVFIGNCTVKAKAMAESKMGGEALPIEAMLPNYPFYQATFYEQIRATTPVWGYGLIADEKGFDPVKAKNSSNPSGTPDGHGYPLCSDWWSDSSKIMSKPYPGRPQREMSRGLEERLFAYYDLTDPAQCGLYANILGFVGIGNQTCNGADGISEMAVLTGILKEQLLGQSEAAMKAQKVIAKNIGSSAQFGSHNVSPEGNTWTETMFNYTMDIGLFSSAFKDFSGNLGLLKSLPPATSLLILVFTALLPLGMIVSRYEIEPLMGMTLTYCGFFLWIPYFRMIRWLDDHFVTMIVGGFQANMVIMLEMMIAVGYLAVPMLMFSMFTIAGVRVAQLDPIGGDKMGSIANKGATTLQNTASSAASRFSMKSKSGGGGKSAAGGSSNP